MFEKLPEIKVLRDPVLGYIHIDEKIIWECLDTPEFQRLRRIKQLGGSFMVYHTAEHTRFSHSLGVYEITRRMLQEVVGLKDKLTPYEQIGLQLAALLHDIGHLPFSHCFEAISTVSHEEYSQFIILNNSNINQILTSYDADLPQFVVSIINHSCNNPLLSQIISSQLDADRMDYLLRDAYFTGTSYGEYDIDRLFRTFRIYENKLVVKESGIHSVEDYIMARYQMYWQVYFHPVARSFEIVLRLFFQRLTFLYHHQPELLIDCESFYPIFKNEQLTVNQHLNLDENSCYLVFKKMLNSKDKIAKDLANRLLNRKLFTYCQYDQALFLEKKVALEANKYPSEYYLVEDDTSKKPYEPYNNNEIWILLKSGKVAEIKEASVIVDSITKGAVKKEHKMYFPII